MTIKVEDGEEVVTTSLLLIPTPVSVRFVLNGPCHDTPGTKDPGTAGGLNGGSRGLYGRKY